MSDWKKMLSHRDLPESFSDQTCETVSRIDDNHQVIGVLYLEKHLLSLCSLNESSGQMLAAKLPEFTSLVRQAVGEIDILDEVMAYRIETRGVELLVAPAQHCTAAVLISKGKQTAKRYKD